MKGRYYDPTTSRFLTHDPVKGFIDRPPTLHRYLYAFGNPTRFTDPNGKEAIDFVEGFAEVALNLIAGGEISHLERDGLKRKDPALFKQLVGEGNVYQQRKIERQFNVDLRNFSINSELVSGSNTFEDLKTLVTLGLSETGQAIGNFAGAVSVSFDSDVSQNVRNQAHKDVGGGALPIVIGVTTRKAQQAVQSRQLNFNGRTVESNSSFDNNLIIDDSVGAARVKGLTVEQERPTLAARLAKKISNLPAKQREGINTVAVLKTKSGRIVIGRNQGGLENKKVDARVNRIREQRNPDKDFKGECAEVNCLRRAENKKIDVDAEGGEISIANVRGKTSRKNATPKPPCEVCDPLLDEFSIKNLDSDL